MSSLLFIEAYAIDEIKEAKDREYKIEFKKRNVTPS